MTGERCAAGPASPAPDPTAGAWRWLRGAVVAAFATLLSLSGHALGGGAVPSGSQLVLFVAAATVFCVALSGRRWTSASLLVALAGAQLVAHVAFARSSVGSHPAGHAGHLAGSHLGSAGMVAAHVLAAAATAMVLSHGESWCWGLLALFARPAQVVAALSARFVPCAEPRMVVSGPVHTNRPHEQVHAAPRRGPPAGGLHHHPATTVP